MCPARVGVATPEVTNRVTPVAGTDILALRDAFGLRGNV